MKRSKPYVRDYRYSATDTVSVGVPPNRTTRAKGEHIEQQADELRRLGLDVQAKTKVLRKTPQKSTMVVARGLGEEDQVALELRIGKGKRPRGA